MAKHDALSIIATQLATGSERGPSTAAKHVRAIPMLKLQTRLNSRLLMMQPCTR
jgi:hypothetical protein